MSEATACSAFHTFCRGFAETLYHVHVRLPTGDAHDKAMREYDALGLTGAIGSTDVTHVKRECCPESETISYTGKEGYPTIAYEVTVDHTGRVLGVTRGFPGAQNDKTIIRYDLTVRKVREEAPYRDRTFKLTKRDGTTKDVKGNYLIVDHGYHKV